MKHCKTCQNQLNGNFCSQCGEKVIADSDFSLIKIIGNAFGSITNLDSKIFKTLKLLLFYPGRLTAKFVEGVRVPYMKPFQIFVISNIVFFIFLQDIDLFRTPSKWFFIEDFDGIPVMDQVSAIARNQGLEISEIANKYDLKTSALAKGLIVLLIPFIALIGKLLNPKRSIKFGKHIIFSTHYFAFILILFVIVSQVIEAFTSDFNKWMFIIPITVIMLIYYILGIKYFYKNSWIGSALKGVAGVFLINLCIQFYKMMINLLVLNTL